MKTILLELTSANQGMNTNDTIFLCVFFICIASIVIAMINRD